MQERIDDQPTSQVSIPSVLVVLLNWNNANETLTALDSVLKVDYPNFNVLIVDNGSVDGSVEHLKKITGPRVELIEAGENTGYTGGCNIGFRRALQSGADYVWLLNNDAVTEPSTLSSLVAWAEEDPHIGLVTPRIASLDEVPHLTFAGGVLAVEEGLYDETNDPEQARRWAEMHPGKALVIGTAMLVRMELVRRIGMLDESFFAYYEDIDFNARSIAAGFRNVVDERTTIRHREKNRNTNPAAIQPHYWYYMARNEPRFWRKHLGLRRSLGMTWTSLNAFLRHRRRCRTVPGTGDAILAGLWDGWLNRGGPYRPEARMPAPVAAVVKLYARRFNSSD